MSTSFSLRNGDLILAVNPGHDGAVAAIQDQRLLFSWEAEQDSHARHMPASAPFLLNVMGALDRFPAVLARSGWSRDILNYERRDLSYHGIEDGCARVSSAKLLGKDTILFESTHERSHIFCSYGLSPFAEGRPCYALVWEGDIGSFYELDRDLHITQHGPVLPHPGYKYSFLYDLAHPESKVGSWRLDTAGKLMALAGFSAKAPANDLESRVIRRIFSGVSPPITDKKQFSDTPYLNCGVTDPCFMDLVARLSDALFDTFHHYAKTHLRKGLPLLIAGGCGLNCEWNSRWRDSGIFSDVFIPPVTNDAGIAIGTAIEAQHVLSGRSKVSWSVYSGQEFVWDEEPRDAPEEAVDYDRVAELLACDRIVAWVQGRSEIGPRALGNRSILAAPFKSAMKDRLNAIKQREPYRPIAPVCLQEDAKRLFGLEGTSPYMLFFQPLCAPELQAVTHVDGSARVQTVRQEQNPSLHALLSVFKRKTGFGVLCNTSLNRKDMGFLNRSSELFAFARERGLDAVVANGRCFLFEAARSASA
jgi:predicted NodU family carbamoyl transferase